MGSWHCQNALSKGQKNVFGQILHRPDSKGFKLNFKVGVQRGEKGGKKIKIKLHKGI